MNWYSAFSSLSSQTQLLKFWCLAEGRNHWDGYYSVEVKGHLKSQEVKMQKFCEHEESLNSGNVYDSHLWHVSAPQWVDDTYEFWVINWRLKPPELKTVKTRKHGISKWKTCMNLLSCGCSMKSIVSQHPVTHSPLWINEMTWRPLFAINKKKKKNITEIPLHL